MNRPYKARRIPWEFSSIAGLEDKLGLTPLGGNECLLGAVVKELTDNAMDALIRKFTDGMTDKDPEIRVLIEEKEKKFSIEVYDNGDGFPEKEVKDISPDYFLSANLLSGRITRGRKGNALAIIAGIATLIGKTLEIETNKFKADISFKGDGRKDLIWKDNPEEDSYTLVKTWIPAPSSPKISLKYVLRILFAQLLLNPFVSWKIKVLDFEFEFKAIKRECEFLKNKFLWKSDLSVFSMENFCKKVELCVDNGEGTEKVDKWLSSNFYRLSRERLRSIKNELKNDNFELYRKIEEILESNLSVLVRNKEDMITLYRVLKDFLRKPLPINEIKVIGKDFYKEALRQLGPLAMEAGFFIEPDVQYIQVYPEETVWDERGTPYFKMEVVCAPVKDVEDVEDGRDSKVVYFLGINGSCTYTDLYNYYVKTRINYGKNEVLPHYFLFKNKLKCMRNLAGVFVLVHVITPCDIFLETNKVSVMVMDERYKEKVKMVMLVEEKRKKEIEIQEDVGEKIVEKVLDLVKRKTSDGEKFNERPTISEFIRENIEIIIREAQGGLACKPTLRQGYYAARRLYDKYGVMTYGAFEKAVTKLERERVEYLFNRDVRGHIYIPHLLVYEEIDLEVNRIIKRIEWRSFGGVLYIEKEGFREIVEAARIAEKYDLSIIYGKGFATEGASLFFEKLVKELNKRGLEDIEVKVFVLHDADPSGYSIFLDLVRGSWFWKKIDRELLKKIHFIDLGLTVDQAKKYGLSGEHINSGSSKNNSGVLASLETLIKDFKKRRIEEELLEVLIEVFKGRVEEEMLKNLVEFFEEFFEKRVEGKLLEDLIRAFEKRRVEEELLKDLAEVFKGRVEEEVLEILIEAFKKRIEEESVESGKWQYIKSVEKDYEFFKDKQRRYELNEFSGGALIAFLEERLREHRADKVKPTPKEVQERVEKVVGVEFAQVPREIVKKNIESILINYFKKMKVIDKLTDTIMEKIVNKEDWSLERFVEESSRVRPGDPRSWSYFIEERLKFLEKENKTKIEENLDQPDNELLKLLKLELNKLGSL